MALQREVASNIQNYRKIEIDFSPKIPPLKKSADKTRINVRYALMPPFAYAHIYWNPRIMEVVYEVEEPVLTPEEKEYRREIKEAMREILNFEQIIDKDINSLTDYIDKMFKLILIELGMNIPYDSYKKIFYYLVRDFVGFNEVDPLLRDYFIEDIECNGTESPVYVVHRVFRN